MEDVVSNDRGELLTDRAQLGRELGRRCRLSGTFTLRSGATSNTYFDKYLFEADPTVLHAVADHLAELVPGDTQVLAGLELGGVPVATALSMVTGLPLALVRKEAKIYGTAKLAEGADIEFRRVLLIEDVVTTGGQVALSAGELRLRGAIVHQVLCVIDRSEGDHERLREAGVTLQALFAADELY